MPKLHLSESPYGFLHRKTRNVKKLGFLLLGLLTIRPETTSAAIALDATAKGPYHGGAVSDSWTHTCTGSNITLAVLFWEDNASAISAVTYNGAAMTFKGSHYDGVQYLYWYVLANASTGAHAIAYTTTAGQSMAVSISLTGTSGTQPDAMSAGNSGTAVVPNDSITVVAANSWILGGFGNDGGNNFIPGDGTAGSTVNVLDVNMTLGGYGQVWHPSPTAVSSGSNSFGVFGDSGHTLAKQFNALLMSIAPFSTAGSASAPLNRGLIIQGGKMTVNGGKVKVQ